MKDQRCRVELLNSCQLNPCVAKINVQGLEAKILGSARETLLNSYPIRIVEDGLNNNIPSSWLPSLLRTEDLACEAPLT